jgi:hypothetical protein
LAKVRADRGVKTHLMYIPNITNPNKGSGCLVC